MKKRYADVVLRLAVPDALQFSIPPGLDRDIRPGQRVRVPLRKRTDIGYVVRISGTPRVSGIRPVAAILDREPLLPPDLLELLMWVAEHNLAPPGLVFRSALPRAIHLERTSRATAREKTSRSFSLQVDPSSLPGLLAELKRKAPVQARILSLLSDGPLAGDDLSAHSPSSLGSLINKGLVKVETRAVRRGLIPPPQDGAVSPDLTPDQEEVFQKILPTLSQETSSIFLLHGVTGSGKSEVYARAVQHLPPERQAIILVPEVSLTTHLVEHLRQRLSSPIVVWHHQLSEGEKHDLWGVLRRGEVRVVVGARSAVFAPLPNVGLIVIDEEQEGSFKQEETPSYHAREVALRRGHIKRATVLMGSATPSLESYYRAVTGEYTLLSLSSRYGERPLPKVRMLDLKDVDREPPPDLRGSRVKPSRGSLLTAPLLESADEALSSGSQVLFFLNRRGFAPFTHCSECSWAFKCPNCQVSLVFHSQESSFLCHYCGFRSSPPDTCPSCRGTKLRLSGSGTQRLEDEIRSLFPGRSVARLDRDAASRKGAGGRLVREFADGTTDILVGTQMAAKGFHFPRLSFVGVLSPDIGLNLPDFRAAERTFQVVTQVAGRAGRGSTPGSVLIQTYQPEHYALQSAAEHSFSEFYRREIEFRRELGYPPFCDLVLLKTDGPHLERLEEVTELLSGRVRRLLETEVASGGCHIFGPVPAPLVKIRNRFRCQILIKTGTLERVTASLRAVTEELTEIMRRANSRLTIDVNPMNLM